MTVRWSFFALLTEAHQTAASLYSIFNSQPEPRVRSASAWLANMPMTVQTRPSLEAISRSASGLADDIKQAQRNIMAKGWAK